MKLSGEKQVFEMPGHTMTTHLNSTQREDRPEREEEKSGKKSKYREA